MNDEFPLIIMERYQTCSILMLSVVSAFHHVPLFMGYWPRACDGPAPWCFGRLFIFFQIRAALENSVETAYKSNC